MTVHERVNADMISAMKSKDKEVLDLLRVVKGEFGRVGKDLTDEQALPVLQKMVKNAEELGNDMEISILEKYLPQMLDADAVEAIVSQLIEENGYSGMQDMGKVMKELKSPTIDGKLASDIVRKLLG